MIYLDCAASSHKKPESVYDAFSLGIREYACGVGRSGYDMAMRAAAKIDETRMEIAEFFNASDASGVIFTQNATHALNIALKGLILPKDSLLISNMEHNAVYRTAMWLETLGANVDIAEVSYKDDETVLNFTNLMSTKTKAVCITHVSNVFGCILPVRRIFSEAKKRGIITILDASQSAGTIKTDMKADNIDILCCPGHKALLGPQGTGILCLGENAPRLWPLIHGGTGGNSREKTMPDYPPDRFEGGTLNVAGIIALGEGVRFIKNLGEDLILKHEKNICKAIIDGLSSIPNVEIYGGFENTAGLFSFNIGNIDCELLASRLDEYGICVRSGLHCAPLAHEAMGTIDRGTIRVSVGIFNTPADAEEFVNAVSFISKEYL